MKKVLISTIAMEIGGVERSLISMLHHFDYLNYQVDLMLYSHTGELMNQLPAQPNLLNEIKQYRTFRMPIREVWKDRNFSIAIARCIAKMKANIQKSTEKGYRQMQYMWKYALPFLPVLDKKYDIAISYLWPHYFVAEKVEANVKIAWIHTDYSVIDTDIDLDIAIWQKYDYLIAVSEQCKYAFIKKYPILEEKVIVIENITFPTMVNKLANEMPNNPLVHDQRFKVLTVARLSYAKGIDYAINALKLLKDKGYTNISWYVIGYGGDESSLRQLILEYQLQDSFILLGKHTNPYPFMKAADVYVQPSRYEGKAVTVGEAQILGKPVLITNYSTAASQVKNGYDGIICDLSVEGVAEGILHLYKNPELRKQLMATCRRMDFRNENELEKLYHLI